MSRKQVKDSKEEDKNITVSRKQVKDATRRKTKRSHSAIRARAMKIENQTGGKTEHRNEIQSMWLFKCERASGNAGGSSNILPNTLCIFSFPKFETAQLAKAIRCCANRKRSWKLTMLANILVRHNVGDARRRCDESWGMGAEAKRKMAS